MGGVIHGGDIVARFIVETNQAENAFLRMNRSAHVAAVEHRRAFGEMQRAVDRYGNVVLALGVAQGALLLKGAQMAGRFEQMSIAFEVMTKSGSRAVVMLDEIAKFSMRAGQQFFSATQNAQMLINSGIELGKVQETLEAISGASIASGRGDEAFIRIALAISQMQAKGRIMGEEMTKQLGELMPAWDILATKMGKTKAEIMALAYQGKLFSREALPKLIEGMRERYGGLIDRMGETLVGSWNRLVTKLQLMASQQGEGGLLEAGKWIISVFEKVIDIFSKLDTSVAMGIVRFTLLSAVVAKMSGPWNVAIRALGGLQANYTEAVAASERMRIAITKEAADHIKARKAQMVADQQFAASTSRTASARSGAGAGSSLAAREAAAHKEFTEARLLRAEMQAEATAAIAAAKQQQQNVRGARMVPAHVGREEAFARRRIGRTLSTRDTELSGLQQQLEQQRQLYRGSALAMMNNGTAVTDLPVLKQQHAARIAMIRQQMQATKQSADVSIQAIVAETNARLQNIRTTAQSRIATIQDAKARERVALSALQEADAVMAASRARLTDFARITMLTEAERAMVVVLGANTRQVGLLTAVLTAEERAAIAAAVAANDFALANEIASRSLVRLRGNAEAAALGIDKLTASELANTGAKAPRGALLAGAGGILRGVMSVISKAAVWAMVAWAVYDIVWPLVKSAWYHISGKAKRDQETKVIAKEQQQVRDSIADATKRAQQYGITYQNALDKAMAAGMQGKSDAEKVNKFLDTLPSPEAYANELKDRLKKMEAVFKREFAKFQADNEVSIVQGSIKWNTKRLEMFGYGALDRMQTEQDTAALQRKKEHLEKIRDIENSAMERKEYVEFGVDFGVRAKKRAEAEAFLRDSLSSVTKGVGIRTSPESYEQMKKRLAEEEKAALKAIDEFDVTKGLPPSKLPWWLDPKVLGLKLGEAGSKAFLRGQVRAKAKEQRDAMERMQLTNLPSRAEAEAAVRAQYDEMMHAAENAVLTDDEKQLKIKVIDEKLQRDIEELRTAYELYEQSQQFEADNARRLLTNKMRAEEAEHNAAKERIESANRIRDIEDDIARLRMQSNETDSIADQARIRATIRIKELEKSLEEDLTSFRLANLLTIANETEDDERQRLSRWLEIEMVKREADNRRKLSLEEDRARDEERALRIKEAYDAAKLSTGTSLEIASYDRDERRLEVADRVAALSRTVGREAQIRMRFEISNLEDRMDMEHAIAEYRAEMELVIADLRARGSERQAAVEDATMQRNIRTIQYQYAKQRVKSNANMESELGAERIRSANVQSGWADTDIAYNIDQAKRNVGAQLMDAFFPAAAGMFSDMAEMKNLAEERKKVVDDIRRQFAEDTAGMDVHSDAYKALEIPMHTAIKRALGAQDVKELQLDVRLKTNALNRLKEQFSTFWQVAGFGGSQLRMEQQMMRMGWMPGKNLMPNDMGLGNMTYPTLDEMLGMMGSGSLAAPGGTTLPIPSASAPKTPIVRILVEEGPAFASRTKVIAEGAVIELVGSTLPSLQRRI